MRKRIWFHVPKRPGRSVRFLAHRLSAACSRGLLSGLVVVGSPGWTGPSPVLAQSTSTLTLEEAIRRFVEESPEIRAAREQVEAARGSLRQASARPNPILNFSMEGFPFGQDGARVFQDQELLFWGSQEFELGGKRGHRTREARFGLQRLESEYEDFLRRATAKVKELFVEVHHRQRQDRLAEQFISGLDAVREMHRRRLEAGDVSGLAQLEIEAEEIGYQARYAQIQAALTEAWFRLAARIGWSGSSPPGLQLPELPAAIELGEEQLKSRALESRADLVALRRGLDQSEARVDLERAGAVPDLTLAGGYKRDFGQNTYYLAFHLPIPLFDRNQGTVDEAVAQLRRQQNLILWKEIEVRRQVSQALANYSRQQGVAARLQDVVERVERLSDITRRSYIEGEATLPEYLEALRVQRDASLDYDDLLLELRKSWIRLEAGVGSSLP